MKALGIAIITVVGAVAVGFSEWETYWGHVPLQSQRTSRVAIHLSVNQRPVDLSIQRARPRGETAADAKATMRMKVEMLNRGEAFLSRVAGYTARLKKQEVVGGELREEESMLIKCRHHPMSIYLKWDTVEPGREVLYVDGRNNGKMVAHDGGWKVRLPALTLDIEGAIALRDARYPVTAAGLLGLLKTMLAVHNNDTDQSNFATCECHEGQTFDGRPCVLFVTTYKSAKQSPVYRKSVTLIDKEWSIPVYSCHFEWPSKNHSNSSLSGDELDDSTVVESYSFTDIRFDAKLTDFDFERNNPEYQFH